MIKIKGEASPELPKTDRPPGKAAPRGEWAPLTREREQFSIAGTRYKRLRAVSSRRGERTSVLMGNSQEEIVPPGRDTQ